MKTKLMMTVTALLLTVAASGASEKRALKGFEEVEINGSPKVVYTQGTAFAVRVEGTQEAIDNIETTVQGRKLVVRNKGKYGPFNISFGNVGKAVVYVTSPDLLQVRLNGSGDFISDRRVDTDKLRIVLRGSGNIRFKDIICDHCTTELTGSGDVDVLRLEALTSAISLVGSGDVKVKEWRVDKTDITLTGSGDVKVHFAQDCKTATCTLKGSGDIELSGHLEHYKGQKRGSGDIDTDKLTIEK